MKRGDRLAYAKEILGMKDPYSYFQAGVLVLNTRAMRSRHTMEEWLEFASDDRFIYNDQDVLNAHCEGEVVYLDYSWNVMIDCFGRINKVFTFAPAYMFDAFIESRSNEKIVTTLVSRNLGSWRDVIVVSSIGATHARRHFMSPFSSIRLRVIVLAAYLITSYMSLPYPPEVLFVRLLTLSRRWDQLVESLVKVLFARFGVSVKLLEAAQFPLRGVGRLLWIYG